MVCGRVFSRAGKVSGRRDGIAHGMLVLGCGPAVADLSSQGGRRLVVLSGGCPGGAACPFRLLPFQIHGEAAG